MVKSTAKSSELSQISTLLYVKLGSDKAAETLAGLLIRKGCKLLSPYAWLRTVHWWRNRDLKKLPDIEAHFMSYTTQIDVSGVSASFYSSSCFYSLTDTKFCPDVQSLQQDSHNALFWGFRSSWFTQNELPEGSTCGWGCFLFVFRHPNYKIHLTLTSQSDLQRKKSSLKSNGFLLG